MPAPRRDTPALSLLLGYGPVVLVLLLALLAWTGIAWAAPLAQVWAAAILIFIAGGTRGLSFFTHDGPRLWQPAVMLWRFVCGITTLVVS